MIKAIIVHICIILIAYLLMFRKQSNKAYLFSTTVLICFSYIIYQYIPWTTYGSAYFKYLYLGYFIIISILSLKFAKRIEKSELSIWFKIGKYTLKTVLIVFIFTILFVDISARKDNPLKEINLDFPFRNGTYYITSGGNNLLLNYHLELDETYYHRAFDINKLGKFGTSGSSLISEIDNNTDSYIYADSVFSPCSGTITTVFKNEKDHPPGNINDFRNLKPNLVAIKNDEYHVVLAHFKQNSIVVDSLDIISKGDFVGLVGNSGKSSSPHLHIHARDKNLNPVEILFNDKKYKKNDIIKMK